MAKSYFACRLIPPRPSFASDMNNEEKAVMQAHINYWLPYLQNEQLLVFGPVLDPAGPYGLAILAVNDYDQAEALTSHDPAVAICRYEIHPMSAVVRPG